ncbi:cytochrome P450 [Methylocystis parvus]|uniref:Cytochrome P450 n=1 Tax=Methylocystis parvus TaxID=134 RepID=A0A6B8M4R8_9HYPH|nr:cytochrome P450 [Methylocystis parvus]QGM97122.1 cytochrome P450 [Methylocystis parvus]WBJ98975.1 cytochrome P450 [Methylocystis parvus OBBP]
MFHDPDFTPVRTNEQPTFRSALRNFLENWPPAAYREDFWSLSGIWPIIPKTVYLSDPELIEEMLIARPEAFGRDKLTTAALSANIADDALFFSEGAEWRWQRRALAPAFRHENLLALVPIFAKCAKAQCAAWRQLPRNTAVDVTQPMSEVTFSIIEHALLGATGTFDRARYLSAMLTGFKGMGWQRFYALLGLPKWLPFPGSREIDRKLRYLYAETARLVAERRLAGHAHAPAILDLLLSAKDPETGRMLTDGELISNLYGLMVAGHETSAVALAWSLWLLAKDQASQERLRNEVRDVVGESDIDRNAVENLPFARQVIQEAMRLFPPVAALGRQPREDTTLGPYKVLKKEPIYVAIWALHRHEKLWDEPNAFDPDRFAPEKAKGRHRCAYMPFGAGPRICIGMSFAMLEMTTILAALIRDFRFTPVPGPRIELSPDFTLRPKGGLPLFVEAIKPTAN